MQVKLICIIMKPIINQYPTISQYPIIRSTKRKMKNSIAGVSPTKNVRDLEHEEKKNSNGFNLFGT